MTTTYTESENPMTTTVETGASQPSAGAVLPCGDCGRAVETPDPATVRQVEVVRRGRATRVPVAKCAACADRDHRAEALAQQHLRGGVVFAGRRYGGDDAADLLAASRAVLDAAGVEPPALGEDPRAALTAEVAILSGLIRGQRWRDRLSPVQSLIEEASVVEPGALNVRRWAHLSDGDRAALRPAVAKLLAERVALIAPPLALGPPALTAGGSASEVPVEGGCLYCGVGSVEMTAVVAKRLGGADAAARSVWTQRRVAPETLGGRRSPVRLVGWLCSACESAAVAVGSANSPRALEKALSGFLGVTSHSVDGEELWVDGLSGWGGLVADARQRGSAEPSPNARPWNHVPQTELDSLATGWRGGRASE